MPSTTVTTLDGSLISATITGITVHDWTADANGLFTTTANLQSEWTTAYATMLAGNGNTLTPLQRLEGNAEAVLENTAEAKQSAASQYLFRQDAQREFDAIWGAIQIDQTTYGINPNAEFNTYTYLKMMQDAARQRDAGDARDGGPRPERPARLGLWRIHQRHSEQGQWYNFLCRRRPGGQRSVGHQRLFR